jgi:hypothetical protein
MRTPRTAILSLGLALALGGCSLTQTDKQKRLPTGNLKAISDAISNFSSDAKSGDASTICKSMLSTALKERLNKNGGCATIVNNQLATASNFTLTIEKYGVSGNTAETVVQGTDNGKLRLYTLHLVKQGKSWRISSLG